METHISQDFSTISLLEAIERNFFGFASAYVQLAQGQVHAHPKVSWVLGGAGMFNFNSVYCTRLTTEDPNKIITEVQAYFQEKQQYMGWWVTPRTQPHRFADYLKARGFSLLFRDAGMAVDLQNLHERPLPPGVTIERVEDGRTMDDWIRAYSQGFGLNESQAASYSQIVQSVPPQQHPIRPFYVARLHGEPVASSALYLGAGVAGIYEVTTIPSARERGIGSAITLAPLLDARDMGYRIGVLQATGMGEPVYQRLGFKTYGQLDAYGWQPLERV